MSYIIFLIGILLQALPDWSDLNEVLLWFVAGGSSIAVAVLFSFLAENFVFWQNLRKNIRERKIIGYLKEEIKQRRESVTIE